MASAVKNGAADEKGKRKRVVKTTTANATEEADVVSGDDKPARKELKKAIEATAFHTPSCPVYQNVVARGVIDRDEIKNNLIDQLTGAVKWTQCVQAMNADGATRFTECGPGKVLQGLILIKMTYASKRENDVSS